MAGIEWTTKEDKILEENYSKARQGVRDMLFLLPGRSKSAIQARASKMGFKNPYKGRANYYDVNFWSDYTPTSVYWAGFSIADASIYQRKDGGYSFAIEIMEDYHLEKFIKDTVADYKIYASKLKANSNQLYSVKYNVGSEWINDLKNNFNIVPRKTWNMTAPTQIPEDLFKYFVVGYLDGDGCCNINKKTKMFTISAASATKETLEFINNWIQSNYVVKNGKLRNVNVSKHGYFTLSISGAVACQIYLDLRQVMPSHHLSRKWDRPEYIKHCNDYLNLHKHRILV